MTKFFSGRRLVLGICLTLALLFVAGQAVREIEHFRALTARAAMPPEVEAIPGVHAREVLLPAASTDAMWWIMHTEDMLRSGDWRLRATERDNVPAGREVHWSSGLMWLLALLAWLIHLASGLDTIDCVQHAAFGAGPLLLAGGLVLFSLVAARRWGALAGAFLALAFATSGSLYVFHKVGEADHHGMVSCSALACVLSLLAGGAGRVAKAAHAVERRALIPGLWTARRWFVVSGFFGAAGLWISTATMVPVFAGIAFGVLTTALLARLRTPAERAHAGESEAAPRLWRWWGGSGALFSLAFYLMEYAPAHMGWRLEVNHPLYALSFWGGGELLALAACWGSRQRLARGWRGLAVPGLALVALASLPAAVWLGGPDAFAVRDSFLWQLHHDYILEFRPLWETFQVSTWQNLLGILPFWPLLAIPIGWVLARRAPPELEALLVLPLGAALPLSVLACLQERWIGVVGVLWLGVAVVSLLAWRARLAPLPRLLSGIGLGAHVLGLGVLPALLLPGWGKKSDTELTLDGACSMVMRDIGWALRRAAGDRPVNVLSGPTSTTALAFYGDVKGLSTLYWENKAGLETAGAIFGAADEEEVLRLCRERDITHVVLFSWDAFAQPYARLHHQRPPDAGIEDCYLAELLAKRSMPLWLRPLHYELMPQLEDLGHWVQIFEFRPDQKPAESYYYLGQYLTARGLAEEALQAYLQAWKCDSSQPLIGRELGIALAGSGHYADAQTLAASLPEAERFQIEVALGRRLSVEGRHAEAVAAWRRALELVPNDLDTMLNVAWLLATSDDASVRNGGEALTLLNAALDGRAPQNTREIDVLAAVAAENGRFTDALALIEQALAHMRNARVSDMVEQFERRRTRYVEKLPFRTPKA